MKNVSIIEKTTGKVIANVPVEITDVNYMSEQEYEAAAWEAAVDDGLVDRNRVSDYAFRLEDAATPRTHSPPAD
jgi:hypothetical protein